MDHNKRGKAVECYTILKTTLDICESKSFDIFLSHALVDKPFVLPIYRQLCKLGYKIWIDMHEMGHKIQDSMNEGILESTVRLYNSIQYFTIQYPTINTI